MKITKILDINFMKNPRIQNAEKIWCVLSNVTFQYILVDWKPRKLLICKFVTHRVIGSKLANVLPLNSLAYNEINLKLVASQLLITVQNVRGRVPIEAGFSNFNIKINWPSIEKEVHIPLVHLVPESSE